MPCSRTSPASCSSARARESCSVPTIAAKRPSARTRAEAGSSGAKRAAMSSIPASTPSVYACLVASAQRPISSSRAAEGQPSSGWSRCATDRYSRTNSSSPAGPQRAELLALIVQLLGDGRRHQLLLRREVLVERAVGQPCVRHERGDAGAVDAVPLEPATGRLDDPPPRRLLVLAAVPRHPCLPRFQLR